MRELTIDFSRESTPTGTTVRFRLPVADRRPHDRSARSDPAGAGKRLLSCASRGEIDLSNARGAAASSRGVEGAPVVIDLAEVEYLDSQGLRLVKQLCDKRQEAR